MLIEHFWHFLQLFLHGFSPIFKVSENPGRLTSNFMRHPGEGLYQSYGKNANVAILSAEHHGPWASCYIFTICHPPNKVDLWVCDPPHKVNILANIFPTYLWFNMSNGRPVTHPIRVTHSIWPKCSLHIHGSICQPVDLSPHPIRSTHWPSCSLLIHDSICQPVTHPQSRHIATSKVDMQGR